MHAAALTSTRTRTQTASASSGLRPPSPFAGTAFQDFSQVWVSPVISVLADEGCPVAYERQSCSINDQAAIGVQQTTKEMMNTGTNFWQRVCRWSRLKLFTPTQHQLRRKVQQLPPLPS
jgi:hypothetical protein